MKANTSAFLQSSLENNLDLNTIYIQITHELRKVENLLKEMINSSNPLINEIGNYLFRKSGKRIRPALLLLCSKLLGYKGTQDILFSALIEAIHTASLIHDDIVDNSELRRGQPTVHAKWGPNITVLLGDYLYIRTIDQALKNSSRKILEVLTEVTTEMVEGEITEYYHSGNLALKEEQYFDIIKKKTASLFRATCQISSLLAESNEQVEFQLAEFGLNLGMAFQIVDDLLDFTGDEDRLGKPALSDLREGRVTLPLIFTLQEGNSYLKNKVTAYFQNKGHSEGLRNEILEIVTKNGALKYAMAKAREFGERSKKLILDFPASIYRDSLVLFTDFLLNRDF